MLVFISDTHLTDDPEGDPRLEQALIDLLPALSQRARQIRSCSSVDLVLLGDFVDLLKSAQWTRTPLRPWNTPDPALGKVVLAIVDATVARFRNLARAFRRFAGDAEIPVRFEYVVGNHDALINGVGAHVARRRLRQAFRLKGSRSAPFRDRLVKPTYGVAAMHGHQLDPWNVRRGDLWPFGDAVVIELLQGFIDNVSKHLRLRGHDRLLRRLKEVYYVRPDALAPLWTASALDQEGASRSLREAVSQCWSEAIKRLWKVRYIDKNLARYRRLDGFLRREWMLRIAAEMDLLEAARRVRKRLASEEDPISYESGAIVQLDLASNSRFIVLGHTHQPLVAPLAPARGGRPLRLLFNTGTWRRMHSPVFFENDDYLNFATDFVTTYVVFFNAKEQRDTRTEYEVHRCNRSWGAQ